MKELTDAQIREQYPQVFEVCSEKYIGDEAAAYLLEVLKVADVSNVDSQFNAIQKITDALWLAFAKFDLLPKEFISPTLAVNESCKFLSGKNNKGALQVEKGYQHIADTHLPLQIASNLWNILGMVQTGSRRMNAEAHIKTLATPYLLNSVVFQLLDVLVWFKMHIDSKPKTHNWVKVNFEWIQGEISGIYSNGRGNFISDCGTKNLNVPPFMLLDNKLEVGSRVELKTHPKNDKRIKEMRKIKKA